MNELPKIDISEDFLVGTGVTDSILNHYRNYPCRLKAQIFVLCMGGSIEATVNLSRVTVKENDFAILPPGSIIQLHEAKGDLKLYILLFSSKFVESVNLSSLINFLYIVRGNPIFTLPKEYALIYEQFFCLLIKASEIRPQENPEIIKSLLLSILHRFKDFYQGQAQSGKKIYANRSEEISKQFEHLVILHYNSERHCSFYAKKIGVTPTHLSNTIKKQTGKTVKGIIGEMVITDAKAQLKSTNLHVNEISDALHFPNPSFFGKYFKRAVGISPQEYRLS